MNDLFRIKGRINALTDGLQVRRLLPSAAKRAVGPFVFFDHMGPAELAPNGDSDVAGHPHIGLATVTYLFDGRLMHRDSIGCVQLITPGSINWMTAGRGIVHSERATDEDRSKKRPLHGLQLWLALPPGLEQMEPAFQHVAASDIPTVADESGATVRVLVGQAFGHRSPVKNLSPTLYLDVQLPPDLLWELPALAAEMAVFSPEYPLQVNGEDISPQEMAVLPGSTNASIQAGNQGAHFVVIGGAPLEQPVRMWWNFVSSDRQRIAEAAMRWETGMFDAIPADPQRLKAPPWVD